MARRRRWIAPTLAAAVAVAAALALSVRPPAAAANPGVVTAADGTTKYAGEVTEDDKYVHVATAGATITLDRRNVAKIDYAADVGSEYDKRHAKLGAKDLQGRIDLAHWANEHNRTDLALSALDEARQIDPANRQVAQATDAIQRQADLDRRQGKGTATAKPAGTTQPATGPTTAAAPVMAHRLLNADEINVIRQVEMRTGDRLVRVRLEHNVARKYMLGRFGTVTGVDAARFAKRSGQEQALEILNNGSPDMAKDVRILTDPTPLQLFKTRVMPIVATSCSSTSCHGGAKAGDFVLYDGNSTAAVYTNFYILMTYAAQVNGVKYLPMDREVPDRSLVLQFGLPPLQGRPPHPAVPGLRPRFKSRDDAAYVTVEDWVTNDLQVIQRDYGFNVSPRLMPGQKMVDVPSDTPATTQPTGQPTTRLVTTRPTPAHGTPLPRLSPTGPTTLPAAP